jgi:hypothetical protein
MNANDCFALFQLNTLPTELMEMLLNKAVDELYVYNRRIRLLPRADLLSLVTACSVRKQWYDIIARKHNRRQFRQRLWRIKVNFAVIDYVICIDSRNTENNAISIDSYSRPIGGNKSFVS